MSKLKVCNNATCVAVAGAVSIGTEDGSRIVITPDLARKLARNMAELAAHAEGFANAEGAAPAITRVFSLRHPTIH